MGVNIQLGAPSHTPAVPRPFEVSVVSVLFWLFTLCCLYIVLLVIHDGGLLETVPCFSAGLILAIIGYGVYSFSPWARWTALLLFTLIFCALLFIPLFLLLETVDVRYPWWMIQHSEGFVFYLPIILIAVPAYSYLFYALTCRATVRMFQRRDYHEDRWVSAVGWTIVGIGLLCISWGIHETVRSWGVESCRISFRDEPIGGFIIPSILLLLAGIGLMRREPWAKLSGPAIVVLVAPYLWYFVWGK